MKFHPMRVCLAAVLVILLTAVYAFADRTMSVRADIANIRSGPGTNFKILWKVEKNHPIQVLEKKGAWRRFVDFEGDRAWIYSGLLSRTPAVIVEKSDCNVRSGPGLKNPVIFKAERGVSFKALDKKGEWIHIEHADGDRGWIHRSLVWP